MDFKEKNLKESHDLLISGMQAISTAANIVSKYDKTKGNILNDIKNEIMDVLQNNYQLLLEDSNALTERVKIFKEELTEKNSHK